MRKVDNGGKNKGRDWENNDRISGQLTAWTPTDYNARAKKTLEGNDESNDIRLFFILDMTFILSENTCFGFNL